MAEIEVIARRDIFSRDPERVGRRDKLILYRVDGKQEQTYFVELPAESWSEKAEKEAIVKAERKHRAAGTTKFTIP